MQKRPMDFGRTFPGLNFLLSVTSKCVSNDANEADVLVLCRLSLNVEVYVNRGSFTLRYIENSKYFSKVRFLCFGHHALS